MDRVASTEGFLAYEDAQWASGSNDEDLHAESIERLTLDVTMMTSILFLS